METPGLQDPVGHFNEGGVFIEGLKKPRNVLIEKDGETVPIFGNENAEQKVEQDQEMEATKVESPISSEGLQEEERKAFDKLTGHEDEMKRLLNVKKELGIHTREDEKRVEEATAKVDGFMNRKGQK